jgi:hypothetical protein
MGTSMIKFNGKAFMIYYFQILSATFLLIQQIFTHGTNSVNPAIQQILLLTEMSESGFLGLNIHSPC